MPTTIDNETELSAVNSILGSIGQSPISTLTFENPEVAFIYNLLRDSNIDVQNEGWHFNTEYHVTFTTNNDGKIPITDTILKVDVSDGWKSREYDAVIRDGFLYDKLDHTNIWIDGTFWAGTTAYTKGTLVINSGNEYQCTVAGTSAASGGPTHASGTATDGSVTWQFVKSALEEVDLDVIYLYEFTKLPSVFRRYITYSASRMAATQLVANPQLVQLLGTQEAMARAACMEYECNQGNHSMFGFPDDSAITTYQPWRNLRR